MKYLYNKPIVNAQEVQKELKVSLPTANSIISDFERLGILNEKTGWKRNREFEFTEYLNLFKDKWNRNPAFGRTYRRFGYLD